MNKSSLIAFLFIGFIVFYVTGGGALFGFLGGFRKSPSRRPAAVETSTSQQQNPFMNQTSASE